MVYHIEPVSVRAIAFLFGLFGTPIPILALSPGLVGMSLALLHKRKAELAQEVKEG